MILSRPASEAEAGAVDLGTGEKRLEVAQDLAWALLNTPALLFNRVRLASNTGVSRRCSGGAGRRSQEDTGEMPVLRRSNHALNSRTSWRNV
jgi:hypothetical protein